MPKTKQAVCDFSGGFFLNHPELSEAMPDSRNQQSYRFGWGLLDDHGKNQQQHNTDHNLIIFRLLGQHVKYNQCFPSSRCRFKAEDYEEKRTDLDGEQRDVLVDYNDAVLYNDPTVGAIISRFGDKEAAITYMPDHGEECCKGNRGFIYRNHSAAIDYDLAHHEFEALFWAFCFYKYTAKHPDVYKEIIGVKNHRYMTDALPYMLPYSVGIHAKGYHAEYSIFSP